MSVLDSTTGIYSRRYFMERLDEEISRAYRDRYKLALMLVSIEFPEGMDNLVRMVRMDDYLYNVGQAMRGHVRKMDVMARFGETCFALLMPHTAGHATVVAGRLKEIIALVEIDSGRRGQKFTASAHIGIAKYSVDASGSRDLLAKAAENLGVPLETLEGGQAPLKKAA